MMSRIPNSQFSFDFRRRRSNSQTKILFRHFLTMGRHTRRNSHKNNNEKDTKSVEKNNLKDNSDDIITEKTNKTGRKKSIPIDDVDKINKINSTEKRIEDSSSQTNSENNNTTVANDGVVVSNTTGIKENSSFLKTLGSKRVSEVEKLITPQNKRSKTSTEEEDIQMVFAVEAEEEDEFPEGNLRSKTKTRSRPKTKSPVAKKPKTTMQPSGTNEDMMKQIMEELRLVKEQLKSKLNFEPSILLDPTKTSQTSSSPGLTKSPSGTMIYAPAVQRSQPPKGIVQQIMQEGKEKIPYQGGSIDNTFTEEHLDLILKQFRAGTQEAADKAEARAAKQPIKRKLDFEDKGNHEEQPTTSARDLAHDRILAAEKYREQLEQPSQGKNNLTVSTQVLDFPGKPVLDDDEFMHITCHVDDNVTELAEKGQFVDFDKLLAKYNKSFNQEEVQKIEVINKDGQAYFLPKDEKVSKINNVHMWEKAFRIYMAMYAKKHPQRVPEYMSTIHHAASKYIWENVAYYDHVYRHWMAKNPNRNWGKTFTQMWNIALCDPISIARFQNNGRFGGSQRKDLKGICWRFNKGICTAGVKCNFAHKCTFCGGTSHGAHVCFKKNRKSENKNNGNGSSGGAQNNSENKPQQQRRQQPSQMAQDSSSSSN